MKRDEADQEAQWLNANDDRAPRLEFYALDQSAGMSDDAWEVASRLRTGPAPSIAERESPWSPPPRRAAFPPPATPQPAPRDEPDPAPAPEPAVEQALADEPHPEPYAEEPYPDEPYAEEPHPAEHGHDPIDAHRPGLLVRLVAGAVMLVAVVWVIAIIGLAVILDSWGPTSLLIYFGAAVLGLGALSLGVAIRRS
jgi:hypothetical protein